jgi:hypothetical protein
MKARYPRAFFLPANVLLALSWGRGLWSFRLVRTVLLDGLQHMDFNSSVSKGRVALRLCAKRSTSMGLSQ